MFKNKIHIFEFRNELGGEISKVLPLRAYLKKYLNNYCIWWLVHSNSSSTVVQYAAMRLSTFDHKSRKSKYLLLKLCVELKLHTTG